MSKQQRQTVEEGNYGPVYIWAGKYKGLKGYYDDNDRAMAIVYLDEPFESQYVLVQQRWLEPIESFEPLNDWVYNNPLVAKQMRVISRRST